MGKTKKDQKPKLKTKSKPKQNQKKQKPNKKEKEALVVDKTGVDPIEVDALPGDEDPTTDLPIALELLLMAFENYKKHGLQYPPDVQFDVDGVNMEIEDGLKELVRLVTGYVEVEEDEEVQDEIELPTGKKLAAEEHDIDCACETCIKNLVEYEASKLPGVRATTQMGRA